MISFVLRLVPGRLLIGQLAGEVEHVASGETATFRDAAELTAWCIRTGSGPEPAQPVVLPEQLEGQETHTSSHGPLS